MSAPAKRATCLQHVSYEGPGVFGELLRESGYTVQQHLVPIDGLPAEAGDFLLVMGGPMSVNDPDPWVERERAFIRGAVDRGVPCLGVCLGSQFLASAIGGSVGPGPKVEVGRTRVSKTAAGQRDEAFASMPETFDVFQWHGEGITLPTTAIALVTSEHYEVQAFKYGSRACGLLFHLELEASGVKALCAHCAEDLVLAGQSAEEVQQEAAAMAPQLEQWARALLTALLD